jgi:hypothetical protein
LDSAIKVPPSSSIRIHPNIHKVYEQKVAALIDVLNDEANKVEATEIIRDLIDKVVILPSPDRRGLDAELHGDLAAILALCGEDTSKEKLPGPRGPGSQLSVVAGARIVFTPRWSPRPRRRWTRS